MLEHCVTSAVAGLSARCLRRNFRLNQRLITATATAVSMLTFTAAVERHGGERRRQLCICLDTKHFNRFSLNSNTMLLRETNQEMRYPNETHHSVLLLLLRLTPPTEGFPRDDLRKILQGR